MSGLARLKQHPRLQQAQQFVAKHRLPLALCIVVAAALGLVAMSVSLYYANGFYRYDLSRPGYEREREEISKPEPAKTYDTTSPVTRGAIDDFLEEFDIRVKDLKSFGDFRDTSLSDETLQIIPEDVQ
jgi:hypothetical protein